MNRLAWTSEGDSISTVEPWEVLAAHMGAHYASSVLRDVPPEVLATPVLPNSFREELGASLSARRKAMLSAAENSKVSTSNNDEGHVTIWGDTARTESGDERLSLDDGATTERQHLLKLVARNAATEASRLGKRSNWALEVMVVQHYHKHSL